MGKSAAIFLAITAIVVLTSFHVAASYASNNEKSPCNNPSTPCVPDVVKIETDYDLASLYFANCGKSCEEMIVSYGKDNTSPTSDIRFTPSPQSETGLLSYAIGPLDPNSKYYFKLKCAGSPNCTTYSKSYEVRTSHCVLTYTKDPNQPAVSNCNKEVYLGQIDATANKAMTTQGVSFSFTFISITSILVASVVTSLYISRRKFLINYYKSKRSSRSLYRRRLVKV